MALNAEPENATMMALNAERKVTRMALNTDTKK